MRKHRNLWSYESRYGSVALRVRSVKPLAVPKRFWGLGDRKVLTATLGVVAHPFADSAIDETATVGASELHGVQPKVR
jgi:hypothetical protein